MGPTRGQLPNQAVGAALGPPTPGCLEERDKTIRSPTLLGGCLGPCRPPGPGRVWRASACVRAPGYECARAGLRSQASGSFPLSSRVLAPKTPGQDSEVLERGLPPRLPPGQGWPDGPLGGSLPGVLARTAPQWPSSKPRDLGLEWTESWPTKPQSSQGHSALWSGGTSPMGPSRKMAGAPALYVVPTKVVPAASTGCPEEAPGEPRTRLATHPPEPPASGSWWPGPVTPLPQTWAAIWVTTDVM